MTAEVFTLYRPGEGAPGRTPCPAAEAVRAVLEADAALCRLEALPPAALSGLLVLDDRGAAHGARSALRVLRLRVGRLEARLAGASDGATAGGR